MKASVNLSVLFCWLYQKRFIPQFFCFIMVLLGSPNELMLQFKCLCDYYTECGHMSDWIMNFMLFRVKTCILHYYTRTHYLLLKGKFIIFSGITCDNLILYNKKQTHYFFIFRVKLNDIKTSIVVLSLQVLSQCTSKCH